MVCGGVGVVLVKIFEYFESLWCDFEVVFFEELDVMVVHTNHFL